MVNLVGVDLELDASASGASVSFRASPDSSFNLNLGSRGSMDFIAYEDQYAAEVKTKLHGEIDVNEGRLEFTSGTTDTLVLTLSDDQTLGNAVTADAEFEFHVTGTVGFGSLVDDEGDSIFSNISEDGMSLAYSFDSAAGDNDVNLTIDVDGTENPMRTQSFRVSGGVDFGGAEDFSVLSNADAGAWTMNGTEAFVSYMPYNSAANISQIINVTNNSDQDAEVSIDIVSADSTETYTLDVTAAAGGVTRLAGAILNVLEAEGYLDGSGTKRLSYTITVNSPDSDTEVYTAYNVAGDRNIVINSTNR